MGTCLTSLRIEILQLVAGAEGHVTDARSGGPAVQLAVAERLVKLRVLFPLFLTAAKPTPKENSEEDMWKKRKSGSDHEEEDLLSEPLPAMDLSRSRWGSKHTVDQKWVTNSNPMLEALTLAGARELA